VVQPSRTRQGRGAGGCLRAEVAVCLVWGMQPQVVCWQERVRTFFFFFIILKPRVEFYTKSMSLKYEPALCGPGLRNRREDPSRAPSCGVLVHLYSSSSEGIEPPLRILRLPVSNACTIQEQLLDRNVEWFRGELVFKAHRFLYHSTLGLRVIKKRRRHRSAGVPRS